MEVPANLRSALVGIRYWLVALLFLAASTFLVSCGGEETTTIVITDDIGTIVLTIENDSLVAGGVDTTVVRAEVLKFNNDPVPDGTTVNFAVMPLGSIASTTTTINGIAKVLLTPGNVSGEFYVTASAGSAKAVAVGEFIAGPADAVNTTLSANPNSIEADGVSTSLITLVALDANGNPVADGTNVNFYLSSNGGNGIPGTLSEATAPTENGVATVVLIASDNDDSITTVTAVVGPVTKTALVGLGTIVGDGTGSGTATDIVLEISLNSIRVKNSGGNETTVIKATAKDETGSPVTDCDPASNIRFEIINGPGGGERLDGNGLLVEKSTVNGTATANLSSGTVSGTLNIQVSIILDGDCTDTDIPAEGYYATAYSSKIAIEAGAPANIIIFEDTLVTANNDGSTSRTVSVLAQDLHGNPVENGTVIYLGLVDNPDPSGPPYLGYKSAGSNGKTTSGSTAFEGTGFNALQDDDILIILEGRDEGGHRIKSVDSSTKLTLYNTLNATATGLDYVAGSAELGAVCGSVLTGNLEMEPSCAATTVGGAGSIKGVAHTKLTWPPQAIFKPFHLYAESVGGDVGDTLANSYYAVAPITVTVNIVPNSVSGVNGAQNLYVVAEVEDGADHDIQGQVVTFVSGDASKAKFGSSTSDTDITDINGFASVSTLDIIPYDDNGTPEVDDDTGCAPNQSVTITASLGGYTGQATVSCK